MKAWPRIELQSLSFFGGLFPVLFLAVFLALVPGGHAAGQDLKDLFTKVFPQATRFGLLGGSPQAAPVYRDEKLAGYVFFTRSVIASVGYTGEPLNVLVGLDMDGKITGALIIEHAEPILTIGVTDQDLQNFTQQYAGLDIRKPVRISRRPPAGPDGVVAVSGASISSVVLNDAILRSARAVGRDRDILGMESRLLDLESFQPATWQELLSDGSILRHRLSVGDAAGALFRRGAALYPPGAGPSDGKATFIELFLGLATPARIGRNLMGARAYHRQIADLGEGDHLLFIGGNGLYSFKGRAYRKSGFFDRIQIVQGERTFRLAKSDHIRIENLRIGQAPPLREAALFILRKATGFNPVEPWRLDLLFSGERNDGSRAYASTSIVYELPARYIRAEAEFGGTKRPLWWQVWEGRLLDITVLIVALGLLTAILIFQDWISRQRRYYSWVRNSFLLFTLVWLGWYADAQLSVINVLTFTHSLFTGFSWDFFLLEPLIFILWGYVALTLLFWGRGVFCGWLCPFGALQELLNKLARKARLPQLRPPFGLHERIWPVKYVIFAALFAISLGSQRFAQMGAEIEPFKTAIVLGFNHAAPFVLYAIALLAIGLFLERFFCRYLCPLGAALAVPARMRMFEWLKRRWQCGIQCHICADDCPIQAIHPDGHINPNECIHCLNCQVIRCDDTTCPPLVEKKKRRQSRLTQRLVGRYKAAENAANPEAKN